VVVHVAHSGGEGDYIQSLVEKPKEERSLGKPRHRWEDNIKMDPKQDGKAVTGQTGCRQDKRQAVVNVVMKLWIP
jgi:hypothetical protein